MTMGEIASCCECYAEIERNEWTRAAWRVRHAQAIGGAKNPQSIDKLLGLKPQKKSARKIADENESLFRQMSGEIKAQGQGLSAEGARAKAIVDQLRERAAKARLVVQKKGET